MKKLFLVWALLVLSQAKAFARGDDNPFPLACINFSGIWQSDCGDTNYIIDQSDCSMIQIHSQNGQSTRALTTIVPDNKSYDVHGDSWVGELKENWDAEQYGSILQTTTVMQYSDRVVTVVQQLEIVNSNLLLQSTYVTTKPTGGDATTESSQAVFRRAAQ